jgi:hypothetical protein
VGATGFTGVPGAQGSQGPQGLQGAQGPAGVQGAAAGATPGVQGAQGARGAQGPQGIPASYILPFAPLPGSSVQPDIGPQGIQGVAGFQGAQGPQGAQGVASTASTNTTPAPSLLNVNITGATTGRIFASGTITASVSDQRLKKNITPINNSLKIITALSGIYYTQNKLAERYGYKDYSRQIGLIAQQLQSFVPEIIKPAPFDVDENGNSVTGENYLTIQYERLVPVIVQAIKEQQAEIQTLLQKIKDKGK